MVFCIINYLVPLFFISFRSFLSISKTADLMPLFVFSYIFSTLITVKLLSASRPLLHKILNIVLKFSMYGKCLIITALFLNKISTDELYIRPLHDFA